MSELDKTLFGEVASQFCLLSVPLHSLCVFRVVRWVVLAPCEGETDGFVPGRKNVTRRPFRAGLDRIQAIDDTIWGPGKPSDDR